ncbi:MAG TPA: hypothetical protein VHB97_05605, partial [Polyangia bacterium]|nr:hypothetical protein [Polyangia bacterium]
GVGYTYINIDSGWGNGYDAYGVPATDLGRFPDGMAAMADYVHARGQKLGIYGVVGLAGSVYDQNLPIEGTNCHAQDIARQPTALVPNGWYGQYEIDWSNPCAQAYYDSQANRFASWGVDLVKVDGTTADNGPDIEAWQRAIDQTGRQMWLTVSAWPVPLSLGPTIRDAGQGVRVDTDIDCYCSTISSWTASVDARWADLPNWLPYVGTGHFPDLDSMPISNDTGSGIQDGINETERQTVMTFWSMASSPLWIGGDIYFMDATAQAILSNPEVIAIDQAGVMPQQIVSGNSQVWKKALPDGTTAVAVYNLGGSSTSITVDFASLGLGGDASARDLVAREELGVFTGNWTASNVPAHGSRLVKLTSQNDGIAGYTFCASEYANCALSGTMDVAFGAQGSYVYKSNASGTIYCGVGTFGSDPAYGWTKGCYVRPHSTGGGPASFTYCAGEGGTCSASGDVDVAFGAAVGSFLVKSGVVGSLGCNNGVFGSDPAYGWSKACYARPSVGSGAGGVTYEAESATIGGSAGVAGCASCGNGKKVGYIGAGDGNRVTFTQVDATAGAHTLVIHGVSADPRTFYVSVNGGAGTPVNVQSSSWSTPTTVSIGVSLNGGLNTIAFYNDGAYAPDLDRIVLR